MTENWDAHAAGWDGNEDVRFFAEQAFSSLLKHVDIRAGDWKNRRVLDFGCGTGPLTEKIAPFVGEIVAVDTSAEMIGVLARKEISNVKAVCGSFEDAAFRASMPASEFDLIVASSVCGFLVNYEDTLATLSQCLSPSGKFLQWDWLAAEAEEGMTEERIKAAFKGAGLRIGAVETAFALNFDDGELSCLVGVASSP